MGTLRVLFFGGLHFIVGVGRPPGVQSLCLRVSRLFRGAWVSEAAGLVSVPNSVFPRTHLCTTVLSLTPTTSLFSFSPSLLPSHVHHHRNSQFHRRGTQMRTLPTAHRFSGLILRKGYVYPLEHVGYELGARSAVHPSRGCISPLSSEVALLCC